MFTPVWFFDMDAWAETIDDTADIICDSDK